MSLIDYKKHRMIVLNHLHYTPFAKILTQKKKKNRMQSNNSRVVKLTKYMNHLCKVV